MDFISPLGNICFWIELESVFKSIPDDKIFLETDTVSENMCSVWIGSKIQRNFNVEMQELIKHNFTKCF
jgi:TatD DNase family protein